MRAAWLIARKDLLLRLRDRSLLLYGIVAPLVLAVVLGGVFGGLDDNLQLDLVVVAAPDDPVAAPFLDEVLPALEADGLVADVRVVPDRAAAVAEVEAGATAAVVFVAGDGGPTALGDVEVLGNADTPTGAAVTRTVVDAYARSVRTVGRAVVAAGPSTADVEAIVAAVRSTPPAVAVVEAPVGSVPLDATTYLAAGMTVFFLLFVVGIAVTGLLEEQRDRTLARLDIAPIPSWAPVVAKALTAFLTGLTSMVVLVVGTTVLVGADWGDPLGLVLLLPAAVLAGTGVVAAVASLARTPEGAGSALAVVSTVLGALGGSFFPLAEGGALALVADVTPHRWFLRGLTRLAGGAAVRGVLPSVAVLLAIALVTGGFAAVVVRRQRERGVLA